MEPRRFRHTDLHEFTVRVLASLDVPGDHAAMAADALIRADLLGIDSHGIAHLPWHPGYVPGLRTGKVNARPAHRVVRETATTALIDADGGMGVVVADFAMKLALDKAEATGVGLVSVANSRHFGAAGHWALMAPPRKMCGLATCNGTPIVAPAGGRDRVWNTNPIAFAAPAGDDHPFLYDAATSVVAAGKLELAGYRGTTIPVGWAKDADYNDSEDPHVLNHGGVLLPLGGDLVHSSYKGHGLAGMVDILSGLLSGNGHSAMLRPGTEKYGAVGHFHGAIRIDAFRDVAEFEADMQELYASVRGARPIDGVEQVFVSGEKEFAIEAERLKHGIPLADRVVEQLETCGRECGVPFPAPL